MAHRRNRSNRGLRNTIWYRTVGPVPLCKCHWCPRMLTFNEATLDHEPALCFGGERGKAVIACWECNQRRSKEQHRAIEYLRKASYHDPGDPMSEFPYDLFLKCLREFVPNVSDNEMEPYVRKRLVECLDDPTPRLLYDTMEWVSGLPCQKISNKVCVGDVSPFLHAVCDVNGRYIPPGE